MTETQLLREESAECSLHRLWRKQALPDVRPTSLMCFSVCSLWWTFAAGSLVFIMSPVSLLMAESPSPLRGSGLILILTACVTRRTHVCFPFIYSTFLSHTLADCRLLTTAFNHTTARWKHYLRNAKLFWIFKGGGPSVCAPHVLVKMDFIVLVLFYRWRWFNKETKVVIQGWVTGFVKLSAASHDPYSSFLMSAYSLLFAFLLLLTTFRYCPYIVGVQSENKCPH